MPSQEYRTLYVYIIWTRIYSDIFKSSDKIRYGEICYNLTVVFLRIFRVHDVLRSDVNVRCQGLRSTL